MSDISPSAPECDDRLDPDVDVIPPARAMCGEGYHLEAEDGLCFYCGEEMQ